MKLKLKFIDHRVWNDLLSSILSDKIKLIHIGCDDLFFTATRLTSGQITIDLLLCDLYGICKTQMSRSDRWVDNVACILEGNKMENPLKSDNCFPEGQQYITPLHIIHSNTATFKCQILCYWSLLDITVSFYEMACYFFRVRGNGIISQSSNILAIWFNKRIFNWFSFDISLYRLLDKQQKHRCFEVLIPTCDVIVNLYPILNEMHPPNNYGVTCYPK